MTGLAASTTQTIAVGPMLAVGDAITPVNATLTIASVLGEMHMFHRAGTTPTIVTFAPTSTSNLSTPGAMAAMASASGMFLLTLTPTLTAWRGWGRLVLRAVETMIPYWENVMCGTSTSMAGWVGSSFPEVNAVQVASASAVTAAGIGSAVMAQMNTQDYGELETAAPSVSVPLTYKIGYLYKLARNKILTTATGTFVMNDDGTTPGQKYVLSDDGTTFTRAEAVSGA